MLNSIFNGEAPDIKLGVGPAPAASPAPAPRHIKNPKNPKNPKNLQGAKYHMLTVVEDIGSGNHVTCRCDCGNVKRMWRYNVSGGWSKSCGCQRGPAKRKLAK